MADLGISIVSKLIEVIGSEVVREVCEMWGYKAELEDLSHTVSIIKNVLLEAESKRELSSSVRAYIDDLRAAVYDADDLFDELFTLAELNQLRCPSSKRGKLLEKVRRFLSSKNQVSQAYRMARQVRDVKGRLDNIADKHKKFGFSVDYEPICRRREETCSYVDASVIIGREHDRKAVVEMLLRPGDDDDDEFRCVTIVGVGGLGKTALAQLVVNDTEVEKAFHDPKLRLWVCVSDQDGEQFDVKTILFRILELVSDKKPDITSSKELLQKQFQEQIRGKKYLLCLDDVWNEDMNKWLDLKHFLKLGHGGSRVVVTTRSQMTAKVIGDDKHVYKLQGLSNENSWDLFEMTAFNRQQTHMNHLEFVEIGEKILGKCHNNPLVIKVVGSLLFGQSICKWQSFEKNGLAAIRKGDSEVMSILKLSYHNLDSTLKSCFSYCALFPKDVVFEKEMLISLWMAQGYISLFDRGQSVEDSAEEHFLILLRRCFFQDVKRDQYGDVKSVKIHDLMHDVAKEVSGEEIYFLESLSEKLGDKIRHAYYRGDGCPNNILESRTRSKIRSLMLKPQREYDYLISMIRNELYLKIEKERGISISRGDSIIPKIDKLVCLRMLHLDNQNFQSLPDSIGNLVHLRFLELKHNYVLETLCDSITELHNLQTLILFRCSNLRELPKKFSKLVKLRHLHIHLCNKFAGMPSGMNKLTNLRVLPFFPVGKGTKEQNDGRLEELKALTNLRGRICIQIGGNYTTEVGNVSGGGYLKSSKQLTEVSISFDSGCGDGVEDVLEALEPQPKLKGFILSHYQDKKLPRWGRAYYSLAISYPLLVKIELYFCDNLEELPVLSKLSCLKTLEIVDANKLEYMENKTSGNDDTTSGDTTFFPSLEYLRLQYLSSLKKWFAEDDILRNRLKFPCLKKLKISVCPNLTTFPSCPCVEDLELCDNSTSLQLSFHDGRNQEEEEDPIGLSQYDIPPLRRLKVDDVHYLKMMMGMLEDENDIAWIHLNQTLRDLDLVHFKGHQAIPNLANGMQYLTSLQTLKFDSCQEIEALPEWIGSLSSLQSLYISDSGSLKSLPTSLQNLSSLQRLDIRWCQMLEERCKEPDGKDWPLIQHIPYLRIR